jgi:hypothetical protein
MHKIAFWDNFMSEESLDQVINALSRNTAISGSQTIPSQIYQALRGYIDDDAMTRARFKIGDNGILNLAGLTIAYGDKIGLGGARAVTLVDVIVFASQEDANNPALWAHEFTHVQQYRDWGVHDFAIRYAREPNSEEDSAYAVGDGYNQWRVSRSNGSTRFGKLTAYLLAHLHKVVVAGGLQLV